MKCYLHIGTEKTGTTTIQHFLFQNRKVLQEHGYYLLDSLRLPDNRNLAMSVAESSHRDGYTKRLAIFSDEQMIFKQNEILLAFKKELKQLPVDAKVICSSEHIQSKLKTVEEINRLKRLLTEVGFTEISVIVYLRNPAELANSLYNMTIKGGKTIKNVPPPSEVNYEHICNHQRTIETFSSVFGAKNLVIRLFLKNKFKDQSLISDFAHVIGIQEHLKDMEIPTMQNKSLSLLGLKILRSLNEKIPKFNSSGLNQERIGLEEVISKHFSRPKFVMSNELYESYDTYFKESNEWVKTNFFPSEEEFFQSKRPEPSTLKISDEEIELISATISKLWLGKSPISRSFLNSKGQSAKTLNSLSKGLYSDVLNKTT